MNPRRPPAKFPVHLAAALLALALIAAAALYYIDTSTVHARPVLQQGATPTPTPIPVSEVGSSNGIVLWGAVIVIIILVGMLRPRRNPK